MVIEANKVLCSRIVGLLHAHGLRAIGTDSGQAALSLMRIHRAFFPIIGASMTDMNSLKLVEKLRKHWPDVPIMALVYTSKESSLDSLKKAGADDVFEIKTICEETFFQTLRSIDQSKPLPAHQFRTYFDQLPQPAFLLDPDGRFLEVNPATRIKTGFSDTELYQKTLADVAHESEMRFAIKQLKLSREKGVLNFHLGIQKKDKSLAHWDIRITPFDQHLGLGFAEDITQNRFIQESLVESEIKAKNLLDNSKIHLWAFNGETFSYMSEEWYRYTGMSRWTSMTMQKWVALIHPDDLNEPTRKWFQIWEPTKARNCMFRLKRHDGEFRTFASYTVPVFRQDGSLRHFQGYTVDISDQKTAENLMAAQLRLVKFAEDHSVPELLENFLEEAETLTNSKVGFYHFVEEDQETISLQAWSKRTKESLCGAEGFRIHYPISEAGVWTDCVKVRKPVIHNDYATLSHKKGLPEGHAPIIRELVVPVMREQKVVAILGVGNKPTLYNDKDVQVIQQMANIAWETVEAKRSRKLLKTNQFYLQKAQEIARIGTWECDIETKKLLCTKETYRIFEVHYGSPTNLDLFFSVVHPEDLEFVRERWTSCLNGEPFDIEHRIVVHGKTKWVREKGEFLASEKGKPVTVIGITQDITKHKRAEEERTNLEEQLRQTQKMEAIGTLAGGIAHDFNNLLAVINGFNEIAMSEVPPSSEIWKTLEEVRKAADRATDLTVQLLAFSRKSAMQPRTLNLNNQIQEAWKMIRRVVGEDIELVKDIATEPLLIKADPGQIHQVLMNLVINASYEIRNWPEAQKRSIAVGTNLHNAEEHRCPLCKQMIHAGTYAQLTIQDSGPGISPSLQEKIFDPFFTTKKVGSGTGLGLSTVYGIVTQYSGHICVRSKVGCGAQFGILWPLAKESPQRKELEDMASSTRGHETILIIEDEPQLLDLATRILQKSGYHILKAASGEEGIEIIEHFNEPIHLLFTDVILPGKDGVDCSKVFNANRPEGAVLFASGYTADRIKGHGLDEKQVNLITKPYSPKNLRLMVRSLIDQSKS